MNNDRRILAWLAILISLVGCTPLACGGGFVTLAGSVVYLDPERRWDSSDSFLFGGIFVLTVVAVVAGLFLAGWGVRSLLNRDSNRTQEILDPNQDSSSM